MQKILNGMETEANVEVEAGMEAEVDMEVEAVGEVGEKMLHLVFTIPRTACTV